MGQHFQRNRAWLLRAIAVGTATLAAAACAGQTPGGNKARTVAESSPAARPAMTHWRLSTVAFRAPTHGYGMFVSYRASCRIGVGSTSDGGARFTAPVTVAAFRCAGSPPAGSLAVGARRDLFLYGPKLFVTHDSGRTWTASRQRGQVLAVAAKQRSVWMLLAQCRHGAGSQRCPLRLLESADGGRTWRLAPSQPPAVAAAYGGAVQAGAGRGQSWLIRTGRSAGYVASLLPPQGGASPAGLWFTADAGQTWSRRATPCSGLSAALSAASARVLFAVCAGQPGAGQQGKTIARSADGGRSWTRQVSCGIGACPWPLGSGYLGSIAAADARTVYLVGGRSPLLASTDGGARWHVVKAVTAGSDAGTNQVIFFNSSDGLVLGVDNSPAHPEQLAIWRTSDGGVRWSVVHPVVGGRAGK